METPEERTFRHLSRRPWEEVKAAALATGHPISPWIGQEEMPQIWEDIEKSIQLLGWTLAEYKEELLYRWGHQGEK